MRVRDLAPREIFYFLGTIVGVKFGVFGPLGNFMPGRRQLHSCSRFIRWIYSTWPFRPLSQDALRLLHANCGGGCAFFGGSEPLCFREFCSLRADCEYRTTATLRWQ